MIPIMTLRAVLLAALAGVQGLSVVSAGDRTNVVIEADGEVTFEHQMLTSPPRIVVDVSGSEFQLPQRRFLDINRGGVLALRSSQYRTGVVRVVVDLAEAVDYEIEESGGRIRVSFPNPSGAFEAWSTGQTRMAALQVTPQEPEPTPDPEPVRANTRRSDRAAAEVPVTRPAIQEAPAPEQARITVEFREVPIVDVLNTFADFSGRSIVPGQGVGTQTITAAIREQPWDEAMRAILEGQGLTATELPSGIIMVTSLAQQRQLEAAEETVTEAFQLQYVSADSVAPQVQQLLAQGVAGDGEGQQRQSQGQVAVNRATNSIIVSARQSVVDRLRNLIPTLDRRTPQVTVQVRILSVRRSDFSGLGVHYEFKDRGERLMLNRLTPGWNDINRDGVFDPGEEVEAPSEQVDLSGSAVSAVGNAAERIPQATFEILSTLLLGRHTLVTWLDAVERLELAELQADPVVSVLDHRTARVHVGERTPLRVVDQGAASAQGPQATVQTEETGVILELTPHVVGEDQVLIQLHAERSEIQSFAVDQGYVFGTQETETEILLDDGQTAVISGLTTTDLRNTEQGIPILMNLPFIGALFRNTYVTEEKEDLLIMVTPYIDRSGGF
ncbi:MAG: AMIN domain-containing protein [Longimicrobiales bacterium]|nr:AMIN domain-containing protein [Longimicrobiales bacterium]